MTSNTIAIYGAGGFAREVAWLIERIRGTKALACYIDDNKSQDKLGDFPVFTFSEFLESNPAADIAIAIGAPAIRRKVAAKCEQAGFGFANLIDPSVIASDKISYQQGHILCAGSILTLDIEIGEQVHINLDCTVGHDAKVGSYTTISPGVHISGNVHIGEEVFIGTGATIINGNEQEPLIIADRTVIGAGACVTKPTEADCLYAGIPAALKKRY